jgi:SsrA-binding protein
VADNQGISGILRAMSRKKPKVSDNTIALNKRARFDYHIEETFEAGLALTGWEVKSLRQGKVQITDTYVLIKGGEAWLIGANITPLDTVSTHFVADPTRSRKLLLHKKELARILGATQQKGMTCVCTALYWKGHLVKAKIGLARGKQSHDKRETEKDRDWNRQKQRIVRENVKQ